jgi:hypothetical protein
MLRPHSFVMRLQSPRAEERCQRNDDKTGACRLIEQAAYLRNDEAGWLRRLRALVRGTALQEGWQLFPPFDARGADTASLLADRPPLLDDADAGSSAVRRIAGRVLLLGSSQPCVLDDVWAGEPCSWRITEGFDFAVAREGGRPVIVSFAMAPLVIARPETVLMADVLRRLDPQTRVMVSSACPDGPARRVVVCEGDEVEVRGVARGLDRSARAFDLAAWESSYRTAPKPALVLGDEDGTRLVIARTAPGAK